MLSVIIEKREALSGGNYTTVTEMAVVAYLTRGGLPLFSPVMPLSVNFRDNNKTS